MTPAADRKNLRALPVQLRGRHRAGLAIVYQIVQAHEGKVWARSKPEQGSDVRPEIATARAATASTLTRMSALPESRRNRCRQRRGRPTWLTSSSAMTNAPSAKCSTLHCAAMDTKWKPCNSGASRNAEDWTALCTTSSSPTSRCPIGGIEVLRSRPSGVARLCCHSHNRRRRLRGRRRGGESRRRV
jgi:hypothetical protein